MCLVLDVGGLRLQRGEMLARVVSAEQQLTAGGEKYAYIGLSAAPVATVIQEAFDVAVQEH